MPPGTVIVGSAHGTFLFEGSNSSCYDYQKHDGSSMCVALVFARDIHKPQGSYLSYLIVSLILQSLLF